MKTENLVIAGMLAVCALVSGSIIYEHYQRNHGDWFHHDGTCVLRFIEGKVSGRATYNPESNDWKATCMNDGSSNSFSEVKDAVSYIDACPPNENDFSEEIEAAINELK